MQSRLIDSCTGLEQNESADRTGQGWHAGSAQQSCFPFLLLSDEHCSSVRLSAGHGVEPTPLIIPSTMWTVRPRSSQQRKRSVSMGRGALHIGAMTRPSAINRLHHHTLISGVRICLGMLFAGTQQLSSGPCRQSLSLRREEVLHGTLPFIPLSSILVTPGDPVHRAARVLGAGRATSIALIS